MKKIIFSIFYFLVGSPIWSQETIFEALARYDTAYVRSYLVNGGDIDAVKEEKVEASSFGLKRKKYSSNLFEKAIVSVTYASSENNPFYRAKALKNVYMLLDYIKKSKNEKELLARVFGLSISLGEVDLTRRINELGADINYRCILCYGRTPILIALAYNENYEMIKFLLSLKPDLTITDFDGKNALHVSAQLGNLTMVKYFVENKIIDINTPDKRNETPIMYAASNGDYEIFNYLVEKGADLSIVSKQGATVLHQAALSADVDFFRHVQYITQLPLWYKGRKSKDVIQFSFHDDLDEEAIQLYIVRYTIKNFGYKYYKRHRRKSKIKNIFFVGRWFQ